MRLDTEHRRAWLEDTASRGPGVAAYTLRAARAERRRAIDIVTGHLEQSTDPAIDTVLELIIADLQSGRAQVADACARPPTTVPDGPLS